MSQKLTSDDREPEISWDDAISRYLDEHPDYFQRNPELLARLVLQHQTGGRAVSLIERQVQVLRDENRGLQRQLRELLGNARDNDLLTARLHGFALALVDARTFDEVCDGAADILRQEFGLDGVRLLLRAHDNFPPGRADDCMDAGGATPGTGEVGQRREQLPRATPGAVAEVVGEHEPLLSDLLRQFAGGKPVCGEAPEVPVMRAVFGEPGTDIKTWALVALGGETPFGVLCLGSRDPYRFHAGMATTYLVRLGELLTHALARHRG